MNDRPNERDALRAQLHGANSHLHLLHALEGLDARLAGARVDGAPHTIFQQLHHMVFWQDVSLARLAGERPERPARAELGWPAPAEPEDEADWEAAVASLAEGLRGFERLLVDPSFDLGGPSDPERGRTAREEILMVLLHNSYHLGQVVQLRRQLGTWPPPRGGDTW